MREEQEILKVFSIYSLYNNYTGRRRRRRRIIRFNDTIEGPRAPVVKPGRITQA
jgi:hypothetical protein